MQIKLIRMAVTRPLFKADVSKLKVMDFVSILDLDPCTNVTCEYHSHCIALAPHQYACVCEDSCPSYEEQVCASNGRTFDNLCLLQLEICLTRANYTSYHPGSCTGTWHIKFSKSMSQWKLFLKHIQLKFKVKTMHAILIHSRSAPPFVLRTTDIVCVLYLLVCLASHKERCKWCSLPQAIFDILLDRNLVSYVINWASSCCEYFLMTRDQSYRNYPIWFGESTNLLLLAQWRRFIEIGKLSLG